MSLAGRLDEVALPEVLLFLAQNGRTGRLTLSRREARGTIVVRAGRIVYAASSSVREALGSLLVSRGLVSPEVLGTALERQHRAADGFRLGAILVAMGALDERSLHEALAQQIGLVVRELCRWRNGYFSFEVAPVATTGDIGVDAEELAVPAGVATERILLEAMAEAAEAEAAPAEAPSAFEIASSPIAPTLGAEVSARLLECAASVAQRGILLIVRGDEAEGVAQLGLESVPDPDRLVRSIRLPLDRPSLIADAVERRETRRGNGSPTAADEALFAVLGGTRPTEALVVPMLLRGGAGLVFYGDNAPDLRPLGDPRGLEWALLEAGLAMERDLLERRIAEFERVGGRRP